MCYLLAWQVVTDQTNVGGWKKWRGGKERNRDTAQKGRGNVTTSYDLASVYYRFPKLISNSRGERGGWTAQRQEERRGGLEGPERELANRVRPGELFHHRMLGDP